MRMILPTLHTLSSLVLNISCHPVTLGGSGDIYEGTLNGSRVCVKRVRVYSKEGPEKATKVHHPHHYFPCLPLLTRPLTDFLPGGCSLETLETSKHHPPPRCHPHPSPTYLKMDAGGRPHKPC